MHSNCLIFASVFLFLRLQAILQSRPTSREADIHHVSFSQNHLFYLSKSSNQFGFISRETGEIMSKYQLEQHQTIISVHKTTDTVVLRNARNKVVIFDITSSHIEQINVQIAFKHQQIVDVVELEGKYYVLTDKDLRVYDKSEQKKRDSLKNIINSGRKGDFFKKILFKQGGRLEDVMILLIKNGDICIRTLKQNRKGSDHCYFKIPYQITDIQTINSSILIQTNTVNYVIQHETNSTYSFEGKVSQIAGEFIILNNFKTYDMLNQIFLDGIMVEGSVKSHIFWIHASSSDLITIFYNSVRINEVKVDKLPKRSWVSLGKTNSFLHLLLQFDNNLLNMYEIQLDRGSPAKFTLKWSNSPIQIANIISEL